MTAETEKTAVQTIAVFDVGSNAVRLTIYRARLYGAPVILAKAVELCELGRQHAGGNTLYPQGREKTIETLGRYCQMIRSPQYGCTGYVAVATEAIRRAEDGAEFVDMIREKFGLTVRILSDDEEGIYGAHGVLSDLPDADGLVADLGGGSLQISRITHGRAHETFSMKLGTLCLLGAGDSYQEMFQAAAVSLPAGFSRTDTLYIIGGSWRSFAKLYLMRAGEDPREVQGIHLDPDKIRAISGWLLDDMEHICQTLQTDYHMEHGRAESMSQAAFLLTYIVDLVGAKTVIVSSAGLRDGLLQAVLAGTIAIDSIPSA